MSDYSKNKSLKYELEISELQAQLPGFISSFLEKRRKLVSSTKRAYLFRYKTFLEFLCRENEHFFGLELSKIPTETMKYVTSDDISSFLSYLNLKHRKEEDNRICGDKTKDNILAILSALFTFLCKTEGFETNPVSQIERSKKQKKKIIAFNFDEREEFLNSIEDGSQLTGKQKAYHEKNKERDYAICLLFLDTGIRISELIGIDIDDINFEEHYISLTRKGGDYDMVYMSEAVEDAIISYLDIRAERYLVTDDNNALFVSKNGRIGTRTVQDLVAKYAKSSVKGKGMLISPHKLRSSFATEMLKVTGNIALVQQQLGHKRIETTTIYARADKEDLEAARNLLSKKKD